MLEIPLHSPEQMQLLERRAAAKKEVIYESHSRVEQVVERKNKRLVQFKNVPSLQIYSTYRCVRDRDRDIVAVEVYRFMHYPISVFFVTSNSERTADASAVDDDYLVRLLSNLIASDTEVRLVLEVPKAMYEAAEKVFYSSDGLSCRKERGPAAARGDDERQRFSERVSVCAARSVTVAIFGNHNNSLLARFDVGDLERDAGKMKKTLKQYLPAVSKVDRLTSSGDNEQHNSKGGSSKPSKLRYILGVKPSPEVVLVQPDRGPGDAQQQQPSAVEPAITQQREIDLIEEEIDYDLHEFDDDEPQKQPEQVMNITAAQLNNAATPKNKPKKSKENKFLNLFKRFKPDKTRDSSFGYRYSATTSECDEASISESGHPEMALHDDTPRIKPSDQDSVASQRSSSRSGLGHKKFVGSRSSDLDDHCPPLGHRQHHGYDSDAHSSVESVYNNNGQQRKFGMLKSSPKLKPRRLSLSCNNLEHLEQIVKVEEETQPVEAQHPVKKEAEIESYDEIIEEQVAKANEALVQSLRTNTFETRPEIEPIKPDTSDLRPIDDIELDIVNEQAKVEPVKPKIEPRPIIRVVQPAKPKVVEPIKPKVEPAVKPKVVQPKIPPVPIANKPRVQPVQPAGGPANKMAPKPPLYIPEIETSPSLRVRDVVELLNEHFSRNRARPVNSAFYNQLNRGSVCDVQPRRVPSMYSANLQQQVRHAASVDSGLHRCVSQQQQAAENVNGGSTMKCYRYSPQQCANIDKSPAQGEISYENLPAVKETCSMLEKRKIMLYKRLK